MLIKYLDGNMGGIKQVNFVLMFMLMGEGKLENMEK